MADDYAGTLELEDGKLYLPDRYAEANQIVVRQRSITQDWRSKPVVIDFTTWSSDDNRCSDDEAENPNLRQNEVSLKIYGEKAELFKVEGIGEGDEL